MLVDGGLYYVAVRHSIVPHREVYNLFVNEEDQ